MRKLKILSVANLIALLVQIVLSYATQFKLLNEKDVGEISQQYNSLFTPSGTTFAIWGVIYTALLGFCIWHMYIAFTKPTHHASNQDLQRIGSWFIINNILTSVWLLVWTNSQIAAATILIFCQLVSLIIIHFKVGIHQPASTSSSKIFTQFPLSIYFGWIIIATIANTAIYLVSINWSGSGLNYTPVSWTKIMIAVAVLIVLLVVFIRRNVFFGLVAVWAFYGIVNKRKEAGQEMYSDIIQTAWIAMGIVATACVIQLLLNLTVYRKGNALR